MGTIVRLPILELVQKTYWAMESTENRRKEQVMRNVIIRGSIVFGIVAIMMILDDQLICAAIAPLATPRPAAFQDYNGELTGPRYVLIRGILVGHPVGSTVGDKPIKSGSVTLVVATKNRSYPKVVASVATNPKDGSFQIDEGAFTDYVNGVPITTFDVPDGLYEIWTRARSKKPTILGPYFITHNRPLLFPNNTLKMGAYILAGGSQIGPARTVFFASDRTTNNLLATNVNMLFSQSPEREIVPCTSSLIARHCYMTYGQLVPSAPNDPSSANATDTTAPDVASLVTLINSQYNNPNQVIIFVPGYNQNFVDPWSVAAHVVANVDPKIPVILYSWPSTHKLLKYLDDETNNTWDMVHFSEFLRELLQDSAAPSTIDILAHSMGNRLVVASLENSFLSKLQTAPLNGTIPCFFNADQSAENAVRAGCHHFGQVIFAAPDVDSATFYEALPHMSSVSEGLTIYGSSHDKALTLSRDIHGHCRAGLAGCDEDIAPQLTNVNAIDASIFSCDFLDHGYWLSSSTMQKDIGSIFSEHTMSPTATPRSLLGRTDSENPNLYAFIAIDPSDVECGADPNRTLSNE